MTSWQMTLCKLDPWHPYDRCSWLEKCQRELAVCRAVTKSQGPGIWSHPTGWEKQYFYPCRYTYPAYGSVKRESNIRLPNGASMCGCLRMETFLKLLGESKWCLLLNNCYKIINTCSRIFSVDFALKVIKLSEDTTVRLQVGIDLQQ